MPQSTTPARIPKKLWLTPSSCLDGLICHFSSYLWSESTLASIARSRKRRQTRNLQLKKSSLRNWGHVTETASGSSLPVFATLFQSLATKERSFSFKWLSSTLIWYVTREANARWPLPRTPSWPGCTLKSTASMCTCSRLASTSVSTSSLKESAWRNRLTRVTWTRLFRTSLIMRRPIWFGSPWTLCWSLCHSSACSSSTQRLKTSILKAQICHTPTFWPLSVGQTWFNSSFVLASASPRRLCPSMKKR